MTLPKNLPGQRLLTTGVAAVTLLLLSACTTAPAQVITLLPAGQPALRPGLASTPPPVAFPAEILPSAEPATTALPAGAATELVIAAPPAEAATPVASAAQPAYFQSAASYYARRFEGRRTATGERYDPDLMTAATRDFPLHSWLKVINPANGREVTVRVNDRTGKRKTPLVDLSRAAAKELGFLGKGKIRVHVLPVLPPDSLVPADSLTLREND